LTPAHRPEQGILDASTVILAPDLGILEFPPRELVISAIALAELSAGPLLTGDDELRTIRQAHLQLAEADFRALPFDGACARAFAGVCASLRSSGRKVGARSYDALIAATAIANGIPLYTCNPADFAGIDGLIAVAVPETH